MMHYKYFLILLLIILFNGCREEQAQSPVQTETPKPPEVVRKPGCVNCHTDIVIDDQHAFACTDCHHGNNAVSDKPEAHLNLVARPASPEYMAITCGKCHPTQVQNCADSLHFTLKNAVNLTRAHFGAETTIQSLTQIPQSGEDTELALVDDMLRRRCLRCHVYSSGDDYSYITRGTGCSTCHLQFSGGRLKNHAFIKSPGDAQCISCHYANHVGSDYYGQYEHDFNWEYRTPYTTSEPFVRPYGVEVHDLVPDIHQQKGLVCIDCHSGDSLKNTTRKITCATCHGWKPGLPKPAEKNLTVIDDALVLTDRSGQAHVISPMLHPAHAKYGREVACLVCHGQWSFNDAPTYLLRNASDDFDAMERLTVQSSSWVETLLEHNLNSDEEEIDPVMADGITGRTRPGVWYLGYGQRRWEDMIIDRDTDGIIKVFRPILDLHLSAVDENESLLFDNLTGKGSGLLPYTPHTTGPAGLFYLNRFQHLLKKTTPEPATP
ncbi:MAG: hypothetical protein L3J49_07105 [Desulfobulbaceae bacterium]|nr:hypothetical protein [Desulfobulbaceae bacterium]